MKNILKLAFIPIIILFLIIAPFVISPIVNDITLKNFARQLNKYPLPQKTEVIERERVCGKLNGNGNGMDFFSCILIKSSLSLEKLKQYYKDTSFKPAKILSKNVVYIDVIHAKGYKLGSDYVENQDVYFDSLINEKDYSRYYIVIIYDGGYSAGFDLRGN